MKKNLFILPFNYTWFQAGVKKSICFISFEMHATNSLLASAISN